MNPWDIVGWVLVASLTVPLLAVVIGLLCSLVIEGVRTVRRDRHIRENLARHVASIDRRTVGRP